MHTEGRDFSVPECLLGSPGQAPLGRLALGNSHGQERRGQDDQAALSGERRYARNDDPETWATLDEIEAARRSQRFDGVGLQLLDLKGFAALDLDKVRDHDTGAVLPWAKELIACGSYAEATPSGTGFRVIGRVSKDHRPMHTKHEASGWWRDRVLRQHGHWQIHHRVRRPGRHGSRRRDRHRRDRRRSVGAREQAAGGRGQVRRRLQVRSGNFEGLPEWLRTCISHGMSGDQSADFQSAVNSLRARGWTFEEALKLFERHPNGPAGKYTGRLEKELRRSWEKASDTQKGKQEEKHKDEKAKERPSPIKIVSTASFLSTWAPQSFLLKGIIEEGRLLTMCGPTGTGKTAIALLMALAIARGLPLAGRRTRQAGVLFLAGENPLDVKTRWLTMLRREMLDPATIDVHFVEGRFSIEEQLDTIQAHLSKHPTGVVIPRYAAGIFRRRRFELERSDEGRGLRVP